MTRTQLAILSGIPFIVLVAGTTLYFLNPSVHSFYPKCSINAATGFYCPGCGSTRALFHLTHGNVLEAFRLNPGLVGLIALSLTDYVRYFWAVVHNQPFQTLFGKLKLVVSLLGVLLLYGIIRNIPWASTSRLP